MAKATKKRPAKSRNRKPKTIELFQQSVCFQVTFHCPGLLRKIDAEEALSGQSADKTRYAGRTEELRTRCARQLRKHIIADLDKEWLLYIIQHQNLRGAEDYSLQSSLQDLRKKLSGTRSVTNRKLLSYYDDDALVEMCEHFGLKPKGARNTLITRLTTARRFRQFGKRGKVDPSMLEVSKELLDCEEFDNIGSYDNKVRKYLTSQSWFKDMPPSCVPSMFKKGIWLIPFTLITDTDKGLAQRLKRREKLVDAFMAKYAAAKADAAKRLGPQYDEDDYPDPQVMRQAFSVDVRTFTPTLREEVKTVNMALYQRAEKEAKREVAQLTQDIVKSLRGAFAGFVQTIHASLRPTKKGEKKRRLYEANIENYFHFLDTFDAKNMAGDSKLAALVKEAKSLVKGMDVETTTEKMRSDSDFKAVAFDTFSELAEGVKELVYEDESAVVIWD